MGNDSDYLCSNLPSILGHHFRRTCLQLKTTSKFLRPWLLVSKKYNGFNGNHGFIFIPKALDRGAAMLKVDKLATGHNADDIAETVLLNILRGDIAR